MQGLILTPSLDLIGNVQYRNLVEKYGFDPFVIMPPNAEFFDLFSSQSIAAAGADGLVNFVQTEVGPNEFLRISAIGMEADANGLVEIADMFFRLRINGVNHRIYGNMADQIGTGQRPTEIFARIFEPGSLLEYAGENNDATNLALAFGRIQGWTIPHT